MNSSYDLDRIGKKMPYKVPDGFFEQLENDIRAKLDEQPVCPQRKNRHTLSMWLTALCASAAAVAVFWLCCYPIQTQPDGFDEVEEAFANLDSEDQMYMLAVFQEDLFMNE